MSTPKNALKAGALTPEGIKNRQDFILWVTDFFHGHLEDPTWGRRQAMYQKLIQIAAEKLDDVEMRKSVQKIVEKETR